MIVPREALPPLAWDTFVLAHQDGWWFHTAKWLAYSLAYTPGSVDLSYATVDDQGELTGVVPLVVDPNGDFVNGGQMVSYPLGQAEVVDARLGVVGRPGQLIQGVNPGFSTYVVDLRQDLGALWRNLRKSYKPLINGTQRRLSVATVANATGAGDLSLASVAMDNALAVHVAAAGRQTRSDRTWQLQAQWLANGNAVLCTALAGDKVVGFAYAICWKSWAYYASGASLEDNVSHALVWNLMVATRAAGMATHFEIGHAASEDDDEKDRSIAFFKSGFGGEAWPVAAVIR